jgi:hypothetical protein
VALLSGGIAAGGDYTLESAQELLRTYCIKCHEGKSAVGGFRLGAVASAESLRTEPRRWTSLTARLRNGEMPPKGSPAPGVDERERFAEWVNKSLRSEACSSGAVAGPSLIRRLNRDEYAATLRDLLDMHLDVARMLPADGSGGEGFDNAAETLFLSPLHSEKYLEAAKFAIDFATKEYKSRVKILVASPGKGVTESQAARKILDNFLPKAFRRPVQEADVQPYMALFQAARRQGHQFEPAVFFALRGVLVSPMFLFRIEPPNPGADARTLDAYSFASRISYFVWGSMPDELLFDVAGEGKLHEPEVIRQIIGRMLRNDRSLDFARRFTEQWLRTRELDAEKSPDAKLFPTYAGDEELRGDIRFQPAGFFRELLVRDLSLLNLIDSKGTIATSNLAKHFDVKLPLKQTATKQPQWVELPANSQRGGLLGMPAVLAVSSYPYRTSPVLRGAWVLDSILGTPPPPPPPNVPELEEVHDGTQPKSMRERLAKHRTNPGCASCHAKIDPLGFALENYDVIGRWRVEEGGKKIDASGELPDGTRFNGADELRAALLARKDLFVRNLTTKMLGYALGRGLTLKDTCAVDEIVAKLKENEYRAQTLIESMVLSPPFRLQGPSARAPKEGRAQ